MKDNKIVSFETALLAKELGFDKFALCTDGYITEGEWRGDLSSEHCLHISPESSKTHVQAPTIRLLQTWLREEKNVVVEPYINGIGYNDEIIYICKMWDNSSGYLVSSIINTKEPYIYYNVLEEGLRTTLKYLKNKNNG